MSKTFMGLSQTIALALLGATVSGCYSNDDTSDVCPDVTPLEVEVQPQSIGFSLERYSLDSDNGRVVPLPIDSDSSNLEGIAVVLSINALEIPDSRTSQLQLKSPSARTCIGSEGQPVARYMYSETLESLAIDISNVLGDNASSVDLEWSVFAFLSGSELRASNQFSLPFDQAITLESYLSDTPNLPIQLYMFSPTSLEVEEIEDITVTLITSSGISFSNTLGE